ncbi:MAG: TolB family protein [Chloroflexota bacterium]
MGSRALTSLGLALLALLTAAAQFDLWQAGSAQAAPRQEERPAELVQRVSLGRIGVEGDSDSFRPSISADGQSVVFLSTAENLVENDTNGLQDVFLFERDSKRISRITVGYDGSEPNGPSSDAQISSDGRFVAFVSEASNLTPDDNNGYADVFLYDVESGDIRLLSKSASGEQGDDRSLQPSISGDGRFVAFISLADNLHEGDDNGVSDVYVYDRDEERLELVSVDDGGALANHHSKHAAISDDGRYVAYQSMATNLVDADEDDRWDIYLRDRQEGVTELISRNLEGRSGSMDSQRPSISAGGRYVAFESWADDLVPGDQNYYSDVFVMDRRTGEIELASVGNNGERANNVNGGAVISADGRFVAFSSMAGNLVSNDQNQMFDVYVRDRHSHRTQLISISVDGQAGGGASISPALTAGGTYIVFDSGAEDLVLNDTNQRIDVFVFNTSVTDTARYSVHLPVLLNP